MSVHLFKNSPLRNAEVTPEGDLLVKLDQAKKDLDLSFAPMFENIRMRYMVLYQGETRIGVVDLEPKMFDINTPVKLKNYEQEKITLNFADGRIVI